MADTTTECPECQGTGWRLTEESFGSTPCSCRREMRRTQRISSAGIPRRYLHCLLGSFYARNNNHSLARARHAVTEFVDCWPGAEKGILFMGGCGVGKTHLAVAILLEIIDQEKPGKLVFRNFQDLIQEIHASFDTDQTPRKSELLRPLVEADLLVLDELGSQKPTSFVQDTLYYLINSRYNEDRITIFTTNYSDQPSNEESLESRIGKRLRSRLHEMTEPIAMHGDDYRRSPRRTI
jgi:DNA replication protein DnaC